MDVNGVYKPTYIEVSKVMGVSPNHLFIDGFSIKNQPF